MRGFLFIKNKMNFFEYANNVLAFNPDKFLFEIENEIERMPEVTDLQKKQWLEGKDAKGNSLPLYSKLTETLSGGRKKAGTPFTLLDTGDLHKKTKIFGNRKDGDLFMNFESDSPNLLKVLANPKLLNDPERIFGLQPKNRELLQEIVQQIARKTLKKTLKL